jgi:hypothetical protein
MAVYLPSEQKWFLTETAETRPYLTLLKSDLQPDGTGSLSASWESLWQRLDLPIALGMTLLVELSIVITYGRYKGLRFARLLLIVLIGIVVNVISLPVLGRLGLRAGLGISLLANGTSMVLGLIL